MTYLVRYPVILFILIALPVMLFAEGGSSSDDREKEKIIYLLDMIEQSGAIFVRNGAEHSSKKAREHLELKLQRGGKYAKTAEDFIDNLASTSSLTRSHYMMKFPDGTEVRSGDWLHEQLNSYKSKHND